MANAPFRLPLYKRIFTSSPFQDMATAVIAALLKLIWFTFRIDRNIHPDAQPFLDGADSGVFSFWHGRMILLPFFKPRNKAMYVLISFHRDGELITKVLRHFGIDNIRGSSSRGVRDATRKLEAMLAAGENVAITPDGPRGPARVAAKGAVYMAAQSSRPLIPVSFSASRSYCLRSWDSFMIPYPFARIVLQVGAPIHVENTEDKVRQEQQRLMLESTLNQLTEIADQQAKG